MSHPYIILHFATCSLHLVIMSRKLDYVCPWRACTTTDYRVLEPWLIAITEEKSMLFGPRSVTCETNNFRALVRLVKLGHS